MSISPEQCRMGRAALHISVRELAERAGVSTAMISRFENDQPVGQPEALKRIRTALEARGVEFIDSHSPGVKLREL